MSEKEQFKRVLEELVDVTGDIRTGALVYPNAGFQEGQGGFHYTVEPAGEPHAQGSYKNFFYIYAYARKPWRAGPWRVVMYQIKYCGIDREESDNRNISGGYVSTDKDIAKRLFMDGVSEGEFLECRFYGTYKTLCLMKCFTLDEAIWAGWPSRGFALELVSDYLLEEVKMLSARVLELELRPPELGGPGYESARDHFENVS